jgi:hypothetical protein
MAKDNMIAAEMHRIREILARVDNPYDRYQLTLLLETAARPFVSTGIAPHAHKTTKGKRPCKRSSHPLPN